MAADVLFDLAGVMFANDQKESHMAENEKISKRVASEASKILRDKKASAIAKSVAGSALTQAPDHAPKQATGKRRSR